MKPDFATLRSRATHGPAYHDESAGPHIFTGHRTLAHICTGNLADEIAITRLLNAFVHGHGLRAIKDLAGEADLGDVDLEPDEREKIEAVRELIAILDGEK